MYDIFVQSLGILAFCVLTASYWPKKKVWFIILQLVAYTLYATHYWLLGGLTGAWCNVVGIIALLILFFREKHDSKNKVFVPFILLLFIIGAIYFYNGIASFLPVVATLIPMVLNYNKRMIIVKIGGIVGALLWLAYGIYVLSYAAMLTEGIFVMSTIASMFFRKDDKNEV